MQIFICEDQKECRDALIEVLREASIENEWTFQTTCFVNGLLLLEEIRRRKASGEVLPEVVISDVEMPEMDGITLGKIIKEEAGDCVFVLQTAFAEYAVEGYETGATRYLLKPVKKEPIVKLFREIFEQKRKEAKVILKTFEEERCVKLQDIYYFDAEDKYLMVHTTEGDFLIRGSLNEYEELLQQSGFFRIHRKYLVNMWHHKSIKNGNVMLGNTDVLPLSRRKERLYRTSFMQYMEKRGL